MRPRSITVQQREKARRLRAEGYELRAIGLMTGMSKASVSRVCGDIVPARQSRPGRRRRFVSDDPPSLVATDWEEWFA